MNHALRKSRCAGHDIRPYFVFITNSATCSPVYFLLLVVVDIDAIIVLISVCSALGGRGLDHYKWASSVSNLDEILTTLDTSLSDNSVLDILDLDYNETLTSLTEGHLVVPNDGEYTFMLSGQKCKNRLSLSTTNHPDNLVT